MAIHKPAQPDPLAQPEQPPKDLRMSSLYRRESELRTEALRLVAASSPREELGSTKTQWILERAQAYYEFLSASPPTMADIDHIRSELLKGASRVPTNGPWQ